MINFQRDISIKLERTDEQTAVVTNRILDFYHDIEVKVSVDTNTLIIKDIQAEYRKSPTPKCADMEPLLENLLGVKISNGFTKQIMEKVGGSCGCNNIRNVLLSSLPLVLNIVAAAGIEDEQEKLAKIEDKLKGTCIGYTR